MNSKTKDKMKEKDYKNRMFEDEEEFTTIDFLITSVIIVGIFLGIFIIKLIMVK